MLTALVLLFSFVVPRIECKAFSTELHIPYPTTVIFGGLWRISTFGSALGATLLMAWCLGVSTVGT